MKTFLLFLSIALLLASCADMATNNTKNLLAASGFETRTPQTAEQKRIYESMEPHKLYHKNVRGRTIYAYKDPEQGVVYVGGPQEHARYAENAERQRVAQDYRMQADLRTDAASQWVSSGRYSGWWY